MTAIDALPLVLLINHPDAPGLATADNDLISNACASAASKFADGRVVVADLRALFNSATAGGATMSSIASSLPRTGFNNPDGHANELGHNLQAQMILDTIAAVPHPGQRGNMNANAHQVHRILQPFGTVLAEASYANGYSAGSLSLGGGPINGMQYALDKANNVTLRGSIKKTTGAAAILEQMTERPLPISYRPAESVVVTGTAVTAANAASYGAVIVGANGHIYHLAGIAAANTQLFLAGGFIADGGIFT